MTPPRSRILRFSVSVRRLPLARLGTCLRELESAGVNELKVDICDGTFAPGFALGFEVIEALRDSTKLPIHAHLMAERPERYPDDFARLGCTALTVPIEACAHAHRTIAQIREAGLKPGVSILPGSPLTALEYVLPLLDRVVLSTRDDDSVKDAPPPATFERVRILRENVDYHRTSTSIAIEGQLRAIDAARLVAMGADMIVIDRIDVLRIEPLDAAVRGYIDAVTQSRKTA